MGRDLQAFDARGLVQPAVDVAAVAPRPAILLDLHRSAKLPDDAVVVVHEEALGLALRGGPPELADDASERRIGGHLEMDNAAGSGLRNGEDVTFMLVFRCPERATSVEDPAPIEMLSGSQRTCKGKEIRIRGTGVGGSLSYIWIRSALTTLNKGRVACASYQPALLPPASFSPPIRSILIAAVTLSRIPA